MRRSAIAFWPSTAVVPVLAATSRLWRKRSERAEISVVSVSTFVSSLPSFDAGSGSAMTSRCSVLAAIAS